VDASALLGTPSLAAVNTFTFDIYIWGYQGGPRAKFATMLTENNDSISYTQEGYFNGSTSAINALQILWNGTGNFDAGTYTLYGVS
jgi:hypothetical protein